MIYTSLAKMYKQKISPLLKGKVTPKCSLTRKKCSDLMLFYILQVLENTLEVRNAHSIQGFVWPAALASRHIIGVCPPEKGKSTAYIPAVVSLLTDKTMYIDLPRGKGVS